MNNTADKVEITELANKLFIYTDAQEWQKLKDEVFTENILFNMSSAGGNPPSRMNADDVCKLWQQGFIGIDFIHHQSGHYIITVEKDAAKIFGYAIASHFKKSAVKGNIRTFVGSYDLHAIRTEHGWRLDQFKYNLKYIEGNPTLE